MSGPERSAGYFPLGAGIIPWKLRMRDGCVFTSPNPNASFWWYRQTVARSTSTGVLSVRSLASSIVLVGRVASPLRASATLPPHPPYPRCDARRPHSYEAGSAKNRPRGGSAGARLGKSRPGAGEVYVASNAPCESVIGGGDGAFVAAAPLCAHPRTFHAVSIPDAGVGNHVSFVS